MCFGLTDLLNVTPSIAIMIRPVLECKSVPTFLDFNLEGIKKWSNKFIRNSSLEFET